MIFKKNHLLFTVLVIVALGVNLLSVRPVRADGETPTEPAAPTEVATEAPEELPTEAPSTSEPVESTPEPVEATATPLAEALNETPGNVEVIVLDENGDSVPLASEEAAEIAQTTDPMWCPEGVLPGGAGCSVSYATISDLLNNMVSNTAFYSQNGVIYFTADPGPGTFNLSATTLTADFDTLKNYNLTLQGGWNGDTVSPSLSGQTNFTNRNLTIGDASNPWVGNIVIRDITFTGASQNSLTVYTTSGDITLDNVDVNDQAGGKNTAFLSTNFGDINVFNGTFDGNNTNSAGFSATTVSGSITISDSSFTQNKKSGTSTNSDGATLSAPVVTLTNVIATQNDNNGIVINSNLVTLNNVAANSNGTNPPGPVANFGSGVFVNGGLGSNVFVNGGTFNNNFRYGIELADPANTTLHEQSAPTCTGNTLGCTNGTFVIDDTTPPTLSLPADITTAATGPSGAVVDYAVFATDDVGPTVIVTCSPASGSTFAIGTTTVNCSATDTAGNTALGSFQVTIEDTTLVTPTPPTPTPPTPTPTSPTPTPPTPTPPTPTPTAPAPGVSTSGSSNPSSPGLIIPVTGGKVIQLDCDSAFWAFGIKLSFVELCDYQTMLENIEANTLPAALPEGYSFVIGLNLSLLNDNQAVDNLPAGASVQMDFPLLDGSKDQFVVLHWNGSKWVEVASQAVADEGFYPVMTTDQTGIFVLVKK